MDVNVPSILLMRVLDDSRVAYNVTSTELSSCSPPFFSLMRRCESSVCRTKGTFLPRPRDMWTASSESACAVNLHDYLLHLCRTTLQTPLPKRVNKNLLHLGTALGIQVAPSQQNSPYVRPIPLLYPRSHSCLRPLRNLYIGRPRRPSQRCSPIFISNSLTQIRRDGSKVPK